jgi:hypothetical protein
MGRRVSSALEPRSPPQPGTWSTALCLRVASMTAHAEEVWTAGMEPETRYAQSEDLHIAYQVVGQGPKDLVLVPPFVSHVEH